VTPIDELAIRLAGCYTGAVFDATRERGLPSGVLPAAIRLLDRDRPAAGPAFTVAGSRKLGLSRHDCLLSWTRFLAAAPAGHIVVCQPNDLVLAHMGELSAETLQLRGVAGYVVDGGTRDSAFIRDLGFPVACRYSTPADIAGEWSVDELGGEVPIGDVLVRTGDYVLADRDGVIVVPASETPAVVARAEELASTESELRSALREGMDPEEAYSRYGVF
jgi:4-hydroxy-4-methyl-2-oxoglutarate aldolase